MMADYDSSIGESYSDRVRYYRRQREQARAERNQREARQESRQRYTNIDFDEALHQFKNKTKAEKLFSDAGRYAKGFASEFAERASLYRDDENAILGGVCAGIADKMNWNVKHVRIATLISGLVFTLPTVVAYGVSSYLLRNKSLAYRGQRDERSFWKSGRSSERTKTYQDDLDAQFEELQEKL